MIILALETASNILSLALLRDDKILAHEDIYMERGQAEALIPSIEKLVQSVSLDISQIDAVAVGVGPGSFTGVRIGLAAARGIGMALNVPVYGVNSFEAVSYGITSPVMIVLDTKRGDYYTQMFSCSMNPCSEPLVRSTEQLKELLPFIACGDAAEKLQQEIGCEIAPLPDSLAVNVAQVALQRLNNPLPPEPLYLRDADVTM